MPNPDPDTRRHAALNAVVAVEAWAETWYRDEDGRDRLSFDGIPCGDAIRVDVFEFVLEVADNALRLPPRRLGRPAFRQLRARGIDRDLRAWGLRIADLGHQPQHGSKPVAFVSEVATPSALGSSIAAARELTSALAGVATSDPRGYAAWRRTGWDPHPLVLGAREDWRVAHQATSRSREAWREARRVSCPLIVDGRDLTSIALEAMNRFVPHSLARLAVDWRAVARYLDVIGARVVVVASDQHRTGRLAVEIARQQGRHSVVLQHGLPQARTGYLPVHADVVLAWSETSAAWFQEHGTARERVAVVGNPRLDELGRIASRHADGGGSALPDKAVRKVLLALSVAPVTVNGHLVATALDAVLSLADTSLIIKLHPGGSDWGFVRRLISEREGASSRVTVLEREPLYPLLAWANVVVVHRSSVAAEALAARCPVIVVAADGTPTARADFASVDLPEVTGDEELARLLVEYSSEVGSAAFVALRADAITETVGPVDGLASRRAADAILAIAGGPGSVSAATSAPGYR